MAEPYDLIHHAVEFYAGVTSFYFAATTGCAALLVFDSNEDRELTMTHFPAKFAGVTITLLCPEETDNRATTRYDHLVEIEAKNFPLELWHPQGANFVFGHFGVLCCVDSRCLNAGDFTAMRAFLRVESDHVTPDGCILRLPPAQIVDVKLRVVKTWAVFEDLTISLDHDVDGNGSEAHVHGAWRWNCSHVGPCSGPHAAVSMQPPTTTAGPSSPPQAQATQAPRNFLQPLVGGPLLPPAAAPADALVLSDDSEGIEGAAQDPDLSGTLTPSVDVSNSSALDLDGGDLASLGQGFYLAWV
ncbi:hypothetical protein CFC21_047482 [Triticum aestivum]|uniref:DUF4283 domain-containing protein n=2 Tax=Triticum aestivum TaxID=4565 RepID=A0A9R1FXQ2_WHEAT|nr:hypothetical protein CFC21_047482 [Triticum aestivum]